MPAHGLVIAAALAAILPARLAPIDQCSGGDSFLLFRKTLASAAAREECRGADLIFRARPVRFHEQAQCGSSLAAALDGFAHGLRPSGEARIMPSALHQLERFGVARLKGQFLALPGADLLETTEDENSIVDGAALKWDIVTRPTSRGTSGLGYMPDERSGWIIDADLYSLEFPSLITVEQCDAQWVITGFE